MIITRLKGGLGNQLFQYATGRALALRNNDIVKLDITGYSEHNGVDTMRQYNLAAFNIQENIATREEIRKLKYPFGIISKGMRFFRAKILREFTISFNQKIFDLKGDAYIDGFFHSERFFLDKEKTIRDDLRLKVSLTPAAQKISDQINQEKKSVSLHVRRGDYVQDPNTNKYHGTCSPEYYAESLKYLSSKLGDDIHVFVFSDDIGWVEQNMPIPFKKTYVSSVDQKKPEIKDYEELVLMSFCKHNIAANSSFSWWGAWLNANPQKIVITPKRWALKGDEHYRDMIPSTWIRI
jgi:hypothetical protein